MNRLLYGSFWSFAIVAIILLAPSSGLITLAIPDEPYGNATGIPDVPHFSKRASDDSGHLVVAFVHRSYEINPKLFTFGDVTTAQYDSFDTLKILSAHSRAPPSNIQIV